MLLIKNLRLKAVLGKLVLKFVGPFRVLNRVGSLAYHLYLPSDGSLAVVPDHTSQSDPDPLGHSADLLRPPY